MTGGGCLKIRVKIVLQDNEGETAPESILTSSDGEAGCQTTALYRENGSQWGLNTTGYYAFCTPAPDEPRHRSDFIETLKVHNNGGWILCD